MTGGWEAPAAPQEIDPVPTLHTAVGAVGGNLGELGRARGKQVGRRQDRLESCRKLL